MLDKDIRDHDFARRCITVYDECRARGETPTLRRIVILAIFRERRGFDITHRALANNPALARCNLHATAALDCSQLSPATQRLVYIARRIVDVTTKNPRLSKSRAISIVLAEKAPRTYISINNGLRILRRLTRHSILLTPRQPRRLSV